jgi:uncharacterized membrane protein (DUF106 family)
MSKNASKIRKQLKSNTPNWMADCVAGTDDTRLEALQAHVPKLHEALRDAHNQRNQAASTVERLVQETEAFAQREQALVVNAKHNIWYGMAVGVLVGCGFAALALNFG